MAWQNFINLKELGKKEIVAGLNILFREKDSYEVYGIILQSKKGIIDILSTFGPLDQDDDWFAHIQKSTPVYLNFEGKIVIHRSMTVSDNVSDASLINRIIPNVTPDEFEIQRIRSDQNFEYLACMRKSSIQSIITKFHDQGLYIFNISLGAHILNPLLPELKPTQGFISTGFQTWAILNDKIGEISQIEVSELTSYQIGEETVQDNKLLPFAAAISHFLGRDMPGISQSYCLSQKEDKFYARLIKNIGIGALLVIFVALFLNFIFFNKYQQQHAGLSMLLSGQSATMKKIQQLNLDIEISEKFLEESGFSNETTYAWLLDRAIVLMPDQLALTSIEMNPLLRNFKTGTAPNWSKNHFIIKGVSDNSLLINDWIKELKQEKWLESLNVNNFTRDYREKGGEFEIDIAIRQ